MRMLYQEKMESTSKIPSINTFINLDQKTGENLQCIEFVVMEVEVSLVKLDYSAPLPCDFLILSGTSPMFE
jgi:hypothetical protein